MTQGPPGWKPTRLIAQVELYDPVEEKNVRREVVLDARSLYGDADAEPYIVAACVVAQWTHELDHDAELPGDNGPVQLKAGTNLTYTTPQATVPIDPDDKELHHVARLAEVNHAA